MVAPNCRWVVFTVGNESRGDDALGPTLLGRLEALLDTWESEGRAVNRPTVVVDFQLQVEHALDLLGHDLALFIDAGTGTPAPFDFYEQPVEAQPAHTSHALTPAAVLDVYRRLHEVAPPPSFVLCVRGESFELGEPLSPVAEQHLAAATEFLSDLLRESTPERWRHYGTSGMSLPLV
jgi:hydrogenase maturation protease